MNLNYVRVDDSELTAKRCRVGFHTYKRLVTDANKAMRKGDARKHRELFWAAGNALEVAVGGTLSLTEEYGWKWGASSESTKMGWDFYTDDTHEVAERVDVKACRASEYNNKIFVEESTRGITSKWCSDKQTGDHLLYVDTLSGVAWLIKTDKLLGVCSRKGRAVSGGDANAAVGYTISIEELKEWELVVATYQFPIYQDVTDDVWEAKAAVRKANAKTSASSSLQTPRFNDDDDNDGWDVI